MKYLVHTEIFFGCTPTNTITTECADLEAVVAAIETRFGTGPDSEFLVLAVKDADEKDLDSFFGVQIDGENGETLSVSIIGEECR